MCNEARAPHSGGELTARPSPAAVNSNLRRFHSLWVSILLGVLCLLVYNANLRQIGSGDTLPARYLPLGIWRFGTLTLDPIARWVARGHLSVAEWKQKPPADVSVMPRAYWILRGRNQHLVSFYPVVAPLLVAPLYLPAVAYLDKHGWQQPQVDRVAEAMEKFSASVLAALASVAMYVLLRRDGGGWSFVLALAFAFGTNTWMTSSQALWQHGAGELLIVVALLLVVSRSSAINAVVLGAVCVLIAANRPPDALLAGAFALCAMWTRRRTALWLLAGAAIPLAAVVLYNLGVVGSVIGGYSTIHKPPMSLFQQSMLAGIAGLLVSPTRGLLLFSPFLIFVLLGLRQRLRTPGTRRLAIALSVAAIAQLLLYARTDWRAGTCWGPRYMTDVLPVLVWMLAPAPLILQPLGRAVLVLTVAASATVQAIGAFWYTGTSEQIIFGDPPSMRAAWDFANVPFRIELRHPRARGELQCNTATAIDRIGATLQPDLSGAPPLLAPGSVIEGWALACGRTPAQLFLLIDGVVIGSTEHFLARRDVNAAMDTKSPSGWTVAAEMRGVAPGEHVLQVALRLEAAPTSQPRIVREQRVIVVAREAPPEQPPASAAGLLGMADRAAAVLRARQSAAGYWLTSYTSGTQFEAPKVEMNTFVTAMMIDFLSPIAREHKLDDLVERARLHLAAQLESNGLVRYHGLPNAPTIGTLGHVITPDADDTALAWRIAADAADARRESMLKELAAYRDRRGLYHTWLAPPEQYQSLNPGRDPNPADATIQMHVYLMLRKFDPPAAQNLCNALRHAINGDDLWVYYAKAPLIPYLRSAELRQRDCAVPLPTDRLAHSAAGQEIWNEVARRLVATMVSPPSTSARQAIFALLARIGSDDFAELRRTPPMLYHNDLTATVSRYYWSEDFGYALWLRLYNVARAEANSPSTTAQ
jgi:hypothetical protein